MARKNDSGRGTGVIRGRFGKPRAEPSTIRRRNLNALRGAGSEKTAREMLEAALRSSEGLVFRATEIWDRTSPANRALAERLLVREILDARAMEDIAWEFVESRDDAHMQYTAQAAARARAFLILVYGAGATSH